MAVKKTLDFLPIIFRSDTNNKFLSATLDQLVEEPDLTRLHGYIGRKFAPTYKAGDSYITESSGNRQNYQLEPGIVVKNKQEEITFFSTYPDLLNKIRYYGGNIDDHSRLFDSQYYSFDPQISYDKLVNFSQYYWLPEGPDAVDINTTGINLVETYTVTRDASTNAYIFKAGGEIDYSLTLARGGTYQFIIDQPGFPFWIQTELGADGRVTATPTLSARDVLGVENNGIDSGIVTFRVPLSTAQDRFITMPTVYNVDYAVPLEYTDLQNKFLSQFLTNYPQYSGITGTLDSKYLVFILPEGAANRGEESFTNDTVTIPATPTAIQGNVGTNSLTLSSVTNLTTNLIVSGTGVPNGTVITGIDSANLQVTLSTNLTANASGTYGFTVSGYDVGNVVPSAKRYGVWQVKFIDVPGVTEKLIRLVHIQDVNLNEKVYIRYGVLNANKEYYKDYDGFFYEVSLLSSILDTLYVQDALSAGMYEPIKIVDYTGWNIDVENDIIGKANYTSPNGVQFTSGLKIEFGTDVIPASYQNKQYYAENIGDSIRLVWVDLLVTPENYRDELALNYSSGIGENTANAEYITINRASRDLNPWSRNNRWFHRDVIIETARYNNTVPLIDQRHRAKRPIIQFELDLQLINEGRVGKLAIDILDVNTIDPFTELQGTIAGTALGTTITDGLRVLFAGAVDPLVRNKIYTIKLVQYGYDTLLQQPEGDYYINLVIAEDGESLAYDTVTVKQGRFKGSQWWFDGIEWKESQQKTKLQQEPLFDVADINGKSFTEFDRTTFAGTKLFGYAESSAAVLDPVLQIPLSYRNLATQGELEFNAYFNTDTFEYQENGESITENVSAGFLRKVTSRDVLAPKNTWRTVAENTKQYQLIGYNADGINSSFTLDVSANPSQSIPYLKVYKNYVYQTTDRWMLIDNTVRLVQSFNFRGDGVTASYSVDNTLNGVVVSLDGVLQTPSRFGVAGNVITFTEAPTENSVILIRTIQVPNSNDKIDILVYSNIPSEFGVYQVPTNLELNARNTDIESVTLGQMRNHLVSMAQNSTILTGDPLGISNLRDVEIKQQGGSILQNSAPVPYASLFLLDEKTNFINALRLAQLEYSKFKNKFLGLSSTLPGINPIDPVASVDLILTSINSIKNQSFPWYYSDMIPYGTLKNTIIRTVFNTLDSDYEITNVFDDQQLSNQAVLVYLNGTQLTKGVDYIFLQDRPAVRFIGSTLDDLEVDDTIELVEYSNTDGNYIPETPTKLGLWPKYVPQIFLDNTYREPINVIQGHDGSITPTFGDYRDDFLLELEKRIYNNIKVLDTAYTNITDIVPGKFRETDYNLSEMTQIMSQGFLNWVGNNKIDFALNDTFKTNDPFTWNYSAFPDRIDGEILPGSWRACYQYFYDTFRPHITPWEMLGFAEKPEWWEDFYGPGPYTGGNKLLWDDLEAGRIRGGKRSSVDLGAGEGIDPHYARPGLSSIIPVDENGQLLSPVTSMIGSYKSTRAGGSWTVGQYGPVEYAWRTSSDFPFAMQRAAALAKPGKYFGLLADAFNYYYNETLDQYLTNGTNRHITQFDINYNGNAVNGSIYRSAGWINWVADYLVNQGINPAVEILPKVQNYEVKLAYKTAGFTDQKYLQVLAEQVSPSSFGDSISIPNENYQIHLYKSTPVNTLRYSAVIVEKTTTGYSVRGYDLNNPFFTIIPSQANNNATRINVLNSSASIYNDFQNLKLTVPYGYEFTTQQQVVDFLISYERNLKGRGFTFEELDNQLGQVKSFKLSAEEFLYWAQQGWKPGSILVLSPVINSVQAITIGGITDGVTDSQYGSKVLDINFQLVKNNNYDVLRSATEFKLTLTGEGAVIGYLEVDLVQYEHVLIFDNNTVFNDVIYEPESGSRQYRLRLIGQKTAAWDGSLYAPGFIYNSGVVDQWNQGKDYLKGDLVEYKNQFYVALENIIAAAEFQFGQWQIISSSEIKKGLLPNFSTLAVGAEDFYNSYGSIKDKDQIQQSHSLIGFKPRQYLSDLGLSETSQIEFYKGFVNQKGSANAVNQMLNAVFNNLNSDIKFYEEWAVRVGEYGALQSNPYVEVRLGENEYSANPAIAQFVAGTKFNEGNGISIFNETQLFKSEGVFDANIALNRTDSSNYDNDITTAGYVNIDDIDLTIFDLTDYQSISENRGLDQIGSGFTIWCAKDFQQRWNVYRVTETKNTVLSVTNSLDGFITFTTKQQHRLVLDEIFVIKSFDSAFDGFYQVYKVVSLKEVMVRYVGDTSELTTLDGDGLLFVLDSLRFQYMEDARKYLPPHGWQVGEKIWIDDDAPTSLVQGQPVETGNNTWKVYEKTRPWNVTQDLERISDFDNENGFGTSIKMTQDNQVIVSGSPYQSNTGVVNTFLRDSLGNFNEGFVVTPDAGNATVTTRSFGSAVDLAQLKGTTYLAVGAPLSSINTNANIGLVYVYKKGPTVAGFSKAQVLVGLAGQDQFGTSLAYNQDGSWLYVGGIGNNGKVSVYGLKRFVEEKTGIVAVSSGSSTLTIPFVRDPNVNSTDANSLLITTYERTFIPGIDYTVSGQLVTFKNAFASNADVTVSQGPYYTMLNSGVPLTHPLATANTRYGYALSSSFDGAQLAVGTPDDTVDGKLGAGSVWVYDRLIEAFKADGGLDYVTQSNIAEVYRVTIEDVEVNDYKIIGNNTVRFITPPPIGKVIFVETNQFILLERITGDDEFVQANAALGTSLTICSNNCAIYVGAPFYDAGTTYNTGAVYKFHNKGRLYGTNEGTVVNPTFTPGDSIRLDNFEVTVTGTTLDDLVSDINNAGILGVSALNDHGKLRLNSDKTVAKNLLRMLAGSGTIYADAGLEIFAQMQIIVNPFDTPGEYFGTKVKLAANAYMLVIGSGRGTTKTFTTFDNEATNFDFQSTVFRDDVTGSGSVYIYELYDDPRDDVENPGRYQYCQQLTVTNPLLPADPNYNPAAGLNPGDQFGYALDIEGTYIIISAPGDDLVSTVTLSNTVTVVAGDVITQVDSFGNTTATYIVKTSAISSTKIKVSPNTSLKFNTAAVIYINGTATTAVPTKIIENSGSVYVFNNPTMTRGWNLIHYQEETVDTDSVSRLYLYDSNTSTILNNLQFIDPAKGRILGQAEQEITYKTEYDPALYNAGTNNTSDINPKLYWGANHVGQVWWDLSTIRFIDYEQGTLTYRSINWGGIFPGSTVEVYEWVESTVPPNQYIENGGNGVPKFEDNGAYVEEIFVDPTSNIISTRYYFWVKDKTEVDPNNPARRLPTISIAEIIENPKAQGIAYAAIIRNDAVILYNVTPFLSADDTILHIDYQKAINSNIIHSEYELIQKGNANAILPAKIVNKLVDSLSGVDAAGNSVPDPTLSPAERYGISVRPRQSMFVDRLAAVAQLVSFANDVFQKNPITGNTDLSALSAEDPQPTAKLGEYDLRVATDIELAYIDAEPLPVGYTVLVENDTTQSGLWVLYRLDENKQWSIDRVQSYKNRLYWDYVDWYALGYNNTTKPTYSVESYVDALKLPYAPGNLIRVQSVGNGQWQLFLVAIDRSFITVGIQNGTIQLSEKLGNFADNSIGYGNQGFDISRADQSPNIEIRSIIIAIIETIFVGDLAEKINELFFTLINYLLTEQTYVDWLFKSSFISVTHQLRTLSQFPSYVRDNQTYYQDYINEVKPYRTKVREYLINYNGSDEFAGSITDFDLPAYYDQTLEIFRSPSGEQAAADSARWQTQPYNEWYNHRALEIASIVVSSPGSGYITPPIITITGGGGIGATAEAIIDGNVGSVIAITVTNSGSGYSTTPSININGSATVPAEAGAVMINRLVRSFETRIKFDRITYHTTINEWAANTAYRAGDLVTYSQLDGEQSVRKTYSVNADIVTGMNFIATDYTVYDADNFKTANDRILGYYEPRNTMPAVETITRSVTLVQDAIDTKVMYVTSLPGLRRDMTISGNAANAATITEVVSGVLLLDGNITANIGNYITQPATGANVEILAKLSTLQGNITNAYRVGSYIADYEFDLSNVISIVDNSTPIATVTTTTVRPLANKVIAIQLDREQTQSSGNVITATYKNLSQLVSGIEYPGVQVQGSEFAQGPGYDAPFGSVFDNIDYNSDGTPLLSEASLDSVIRSSYTDILLGTRAEDINIEGGKYVDTYSSHAPEELIPGRVYDTLDMQVYTKINGNTEVLGYRLFTNMLDYVTYTRVADEFSTTLTQALLPADTEIHVEDAAALMVPNPAANLPGILFIGCERIAYYSINRTTNVISQLRRGTHGTAIMPIHGIGARVIDSGQTQHIPTITVGTNNANVSVWFNSGANVATDGTGFEGSTTAAVDFLKASTAGNIQIATVSEMIITEDAVNTITTEDGHILVEEDQA
jgi:hypothetical protein